MRKEMMKGMMEGGKELSIEESNEERNAERKCTDGERNEDAGKEKIMYLLSDSCVGRGFLP